MRSEANGLQAQTTTSPEELQATQLSYPHQSAERSQCLLIEPSPPASIMTPWDRSPLLVAIPLWMCFGKVAALTEPEICYVLDGILFLYGIILTTLYCRIRIYNAREAKAEKGKPKQNAEEGIYTGLTPHAADTYETIGMKK